MKLRILSPAAIAIWLAVAASAHAVYLPNVPPIVGASANANFVPR
jgi:hypothetical protein